MTFDLSKKLISVLLVILLLLPLASVTALGDGEPDEAPTAASAQSDAGAFGQEDGSEQPEDRETEPAAPQPEEQPDDPELPDGEEKTDEAKPDEADDGESGEPDAGEQEPESGDASDEPGEGFDPAARPADAPEEELFPLASEIYKDFVFKADTIWQTYGDTMFIAVSNAATLLSAVNTINSIGSGNYIIALSADITVPASMAPALRFTCGNTILLGCGRSLTFLASDGCEPRLVVDGENAVLSLSCGEYADELTVVGARPAVDEDFASLIEVRAGELWICDGATVTSHRAGHGVGGAICVRGGSFKMYGGTVEDCGVVGYGEVCGGGVGVLWGGSFKMYGGTITGCYAVSIDGESRGGGIAAVGCEAEAAYEFAPVQFFGGTVTGCRANYGGGTAFVRFPGAAVLGGVAIRGNLTYGADADSGAGVWFDAADGFALYVYDRCVIRDNTFYGPDAVTTGLEARWEVLQKVGGADSEAEDAGEEPEPVLVEAVRSDAAFSLAEDAGLFAQTSDLCGDDPDGEIIRVGVLQSGAYISLGQGVDALLPEPEPSEPEEEPAIRPTAAKPLSANADTDPVK